MEEPSPTVLLVSAAEGERQALGHLLATAHLGVLQAEDAPGALAQLASTSVDAVVADARLASADGIALLRQIGEQWPRTLRFALAARQDREVLLQPVALSGVHHFLSRPWDEGEVREIVLGALEQRRRQEAEMEGLPRLIDRLEALPPLPGIYQELRRAIWGGEEPSVEEVGRIVLRDPVVAARVLRTANSAFFGQRRRVETMSRAIFVLGLYMVEKLALAVSLFEELGNAPLAVFEQEAFWQHSLACGLAARSAAAPLEKDRDYLEKVVLAGLLHDLGKLVLARNLGASYARLVARARAESAPLGQVEQRELGTTHAALGGHLAEWWDLPAAIADAIRSHEAPAAGACDPRLAALVHIGDVLAHRLGIGQSGTSAAPPAQPLALATLGMDLESLGDVQDRLERLQEKGEFLPP